MGIVVQKYGGSSVATVERLRAVAAQVVQRKRAGTQVVVVVSAMGKTTDGLIEQARQVSANPPRRELDMLVTAGERISMALLSMAIADLGEEAISFTGSQSGIITDDSHQGARIVEVRPYRLQEELAKDRIVIVAGFQGVSLRREITTLGRGGSDTTAVALAAALSADACEIYSDVDGVYSADPSVVPQARLLPELRYEVMQSMAFAGAKVLNADAVEFARRAGIAIHARKTGDSSGRQTVVSAAAAEVSGLVAVVGAGKVTVVEGAQTQWREVGAGLRRAGGRVVAMAQDGRRYWALVDRTGVPGASSLPISELAARSGAVTRDVNLVTLVGTSLLAREVIDEGLAALGSMPCEVERVVAGDLACHFVVPSGGGDDAVRQLHRVLLSESAARA